MANFLTGSMGASIYYVRKIVGILDPLPPLRSHFTQPISTVIRKFGQFLNPPPPSRCERNKWIAPNGTGVKYVRQIKMIKCEHQIFLSRIREMNFTQPFIMNLS